MGQNPEKKKNYTTGKVYGYFYKTKQKSKTHAHTNNYGSLDKLRKISRPNEEKTPRRMNLFSRNDYISYFY